MTNTTPAASAPSTSTVSDLLAMQTQTSAIQASGVHATVAEWLFLQVAVDFITEAGLPGLGEALAQAHAAQKQAYWHAEGQGKELYTLLRRHGLFAMADRLRGVGAGCAPMRPLRDQGLIAMADRPSSEEA